MASVELSPEIVSGLLSNVGNLRAADVTKKAPAPQRSLIHDAVLGKGRNAPIVDKSFLEDLTGKINQVLDALNKSLHFQVHKSTKRIMVKVVDDSTGEVIREIPPTKFLDMVSKLEKLVGFVMDEKA
ncbi:MAG: flagellar protein FlaG [bacterium]